jgi:glycine cleavage system H protein
MFPTRGRQAGSRPEADVRPRAAAGCGVEQNLCGRATTMASYPTDLRYTDKHVWARARETLVTVGVTEFAADQLGAIGFVELPYPGEIFKTGDPVGRMRSDTGSAAIHMPFIGKINAVNQALGDSPGLINNDPYGEGWIVRIEPGDPAHVENLMDAAEYEALVSASGE